MGGIGFQEKKIQEAVQNASLMIGIKKRRKTKMTQNFKAQFNNRERETALLYFDTMSELAKQEEIRQYQYKEKEDVY